jgi:hypothetical protein
MQSVSDRHAQTGGCLICGLAKELVAEVGHRIEERDDVRLHLLSVHFLIALFSGQWRPRVRKQVKLIFHM